MPQSVYHVTDRTPKPGDTRSTRAVKVLNSKQTLTPDAIAVRDHLFDHDLLTLYSHTESSLPPVMGRWDSSPKNAVVVIVARWRHSRRMTLPNLSIWLPSLATKLAWPTLFVRLTDQAQVSKYEVSKLSPHYGLSLALDLVDLRLRAPFSGVYTKFSGRLSEEPLPWLIQKFPCI